MVLNVFPHKKVEVTIDKRHTIYILNFPDRFKRLYMSN